MRHPAHHVQTTRFTAAQREGGVAQRGEERRAAAGSVNTRPLSSFEFSARVRSCSGSAAFGRHAKTRLSVTASSGSSASYGKSDAEEEERPR